MRPLIVALVVLGFALETPPLLAAPPDDIAVYCRTVHPSMQTQVRCLYTERASQDRVARTRATTDPGAWERCQSTSASWAAMEICVAQAPTGGSVPASVGGGGGGATGEERREARPEQGGGAAPAAVGGTPTPATTSAEPPPAAAASSPSTIILGPQAGAPAPAPTERDRATRPVTEAEAERQLQGVLEREGRPAARCTKKQYSGGWVTVCD